MTGTVQRRHRHRSPNTDLPSHLQCEISRSNPRGSTFCRLCSFALGSQATVVLKGKSRVTQRYPREVLRRDDREGTTDVLVYLDSACWPRELPKSRKSSSSEQTRDKVRRRFTLSVTAESWWDDRAGTDVTGGPGRCRCSRLIRKGVTRMVSPT